MRSVWIPWAGLRDPDPDAAAQTAEKLLVTLHKTNNMVQTSRLFGFISAGLRDEDSEAAARNADKVDAALAAASHTIRGAKYTIGSQQHFYMEPQVWCHIEHVAEN